MSGLELEGRGRFIVFLQYFFSEYQGGNCSHLMFKGGMLELPDSMCVVAASFEWVPFVIGLLVGVLCSAIMMVIWEIVARMGYTVTFGYVVSLMADVCTDNSMVASIKGCLTVLWVCLSFHKCQGRGVEVEVGRSEGTAASTNPFLSPKTSTPKKKIRLTPRRINFNSVETTLMSPSFFSVEASVPGAGGNLSGGLDSPRGFVGEQVLLRPVPQPGGLHAGGISVENDLFTPPRGSVSSNPFRTAEDVGGALLRNDLSALPPGSPSRNMFQPEKTVERPMSQNDSSVLPQKTPSLNPFNAEHVGVLARSEPVRVRVSANSVRGSFIKSLGRQHRLAQRQSLGRELQDVQGQLTDEAYLRVGLHDISASPEYSSPEGQDCTEDHKNSLVKPEISRIVDLPKAPVRKSVREKKAPERFQEIGSLFKILLMHLVVASRCFLGFNFFGVNF